MADTNRYNFFAEELKEYHRKIDKARRKDERRYNFNQMDEEDGGGYQEWEPQRGGSQPWDSNSILPPDELQTMRTPQELARRKMSNLGVARGWVPPYDPNAPAYGAVPERPEVNLDIKKPSPKEFREMYLKYHNIPKTLPAFGPQGWMTDAESADAQKRYDQWNDYQTALKEADIIYNKRWPGVMDKPIIANEQAARIASLPLPAILDPESGRTKPFFSNTPHELLQSPEAQIMSMTPITAGGKYAFGIDAALNAGFGGAMIADTFAHRKEMTPEEIIANVAMGGLAVAGGTAGLKQPIKAAGEALANRQGYRTVGEMLGNERGFINLTGDPDKDIKTLSDILSKPGRLPKEVSEGYFTRPMLESIKVESEAKKFVKDTVSDVLKRGGKLEDAIFYIDNEIAEAEKGMNLASIPYGFTASKYQKRFGNIPKANLPYTSGKEISTYHETLMAEKTQILKQIENQAQAPRMAAGTSVQTGLPGMGRESAQSQMFGEANTAVGQGGVKQTLVDTEKLKAQQAARPLEGQTAMPETKEPWLMSKEEWETTHLNVSKTETKALKAFPGSPVQKDLAWATPERIRLEYGVEPKGKIPTVTHKQVIQKALSEDKPVPAEVLADYPDLKAPTKPAGVQQKGDFSQLPASTGARVSTKEGMARVEKAKQELRDIINNPDIKGKQRVDAIANRKELIGFLEANADTRKPFDTGYFKGDQIAYTGVKTKEGYDEFIYLEGANAGDYGQHTRTKPAVQPSAPTVKENLTVQPEVSSSVKPVAREPDFVNKPDYTITNEPGRTGVPSEPGTMTEIRPQEPVNTPPPDFSYPVKEPTIEPAGRIKYGEGYSTEYMPVRKDIPSEPGTMVEFIPGADVPSTPGSMTTIKARVPIWRNAVPSTQPGASGAGAGGTVPPTTGGTGGTFPSWRGWQPGKSSTATQQAVNSLETIEKAMEPEVKTLTQQITDAKNAFVRAIYQANRAVKALENKIGGNAWKLMKVVPGSYARGENIIETTSQAIYRKAGKNLKDFATYLALKRNEDILAKYGPGTKLTGNLQGWAGVTQALDQLKAKVGAQKFAELEALAQEYYKINDQYGLGALLKEGIIDQKTYQALKTSNPHYVPLQRQGFSKMPTDQYVKAIASVSDTGIESLEPAGSTRNLLNVLASHDAGIIADQVRIAKNRAAKAIVESVQELERKSGQKLMSWVENKDINPLDLNAAVHDDLTDTVSFFKDGKKYTANVPRDIAVAAKSMDDESLNLLLKIIQNTNMPLMKGAVVYNPAYLAVNVTRDMLTAFFRERLIPLSPAYFKGLVAAVKKNNLYKEVLDEGGLMSGIVETMLKSDKIKPTGRVYGGIPVRNIGDVALYLPRMLAKANVVAEQSTRIATYSMLRKRGVPALEAAVRARDVTVDFAQMGTLMKSINAVIPFSNAALQGSVNVLRTFKNDPKWALAATAAFALPTAASRLNNMRYESSKDIPYYEYTNYWVIQFGEYTNEDGGKSPLYFKIPKGQIGSMLTFPEEAVFNYAQNKNDRSLGSIAVEAGVQALQASSPVPTDVTGFLPAVLDTGVSLSTGVNTFTKQPIVPEREQNLLPEQQYDDKTGRLSVAAGQLFKTSPRMIDFAIKNYTAGTGQAAMWLIDQGMTAGGYEPQTYGAAQKPAQSTAEAISSIPGVNRYIGTKDTQQIREGWDKLNQVTEQTNRQFNQIKGVNELGIRLGQVGDSINKRELTPIQRADYQARMSEIVIPATTQFMNSIRSYPPETQKKLLANYISNLKEQAKNVYYVQLNQSQQGNTAPESVQPSQTPVPAPATQTVTPTMTLPNTPTSTLRRGWFTR